MSSADPRTTITQTRVDQMLVPDLHVVVMQPDGTRLGQAVGLEPVRIGSAVPCNIVVKDTKVSRMHCEIRLTEHGPLLKDLGSKNGLVMGHAKILEAWLEVGASVMLGDCTLTIVTAGPPSPVSLSVASRFGPAIGKSVAMRKLFRTLEHVSKFDSPVLLQGELGTGKRTLAEAIHRASPWADGPFKVSYPFTAYTATLTERY